MCRRFASAVRIGRRMWSRSNFCPPGDKRELVLPLESGNYRLRALELPGSQDVQVSSEGETSAQVTLSRNGWSEETLRVSEEFSLALKNDTDAEQLVILERLEWSDQATTAAEVTALQMFRDLFASEALRPGEQISVGTLTVLFTDLRNSTQLYREIGDATAFGRVMSHFDVVKKAIVDHDGAVVKTIGDAVMAVFRSAADGVQAMLEVQRMLADGQSAFATESRTEHWSMHRRHAQRSTRLLWFDCKHGRAFGVSVIRFRRDNLTLGL